MLVDAHTHIFPPAMIERRADLAARDPAFSVMYGDPVAKMATAEDLLDSMDRAGVDVSWAHGFAWRSPTDCTAHNDYLLAAAARSNGRLVPFATIQAGDPDTAVAELLRVIQRGARGLGELRPIDQGYSLDDVGVRRVFEAVRAAGLPVVFHVSEPVGHTYPGKSGLDLAQFVRFADWFAPGVTIAAHWGGGLPFYTLMLEVRESLRGTYFDTAATSLLYDPAIFEVAASLVGHDRILWGTDFPLLSQARQLERVKAATPFGAWPAVLGENAVALLSGEGATEPSKSITP